MISEPIPFSDTAAASPFPWWAKAATVLALAFGLGILLPLVFAGLVSIITLISGGVA
ncbi:MAG: hypothetical protein HQL66_03190 [Magnetococcales bacterium]|nr:hypothetical protein [Magnetococcales bacterium]